MKIVHRLLLLLLICPFAINVFAQDSGSSYILTPKPRPEPRINGPQVFGVRPGHPVLYTIPATGMLPMQFSAQHLPKGIKLNKRNGQISGAIDQPGEYVILLEAKNEKGIAKRKFKIIVGENIALTPPMGWNSWNIYGTKITQALMLANAKAMVSSGLINHGWTYINMDNGWQGKRGGKWNAIQPNAKFPDMQQLSDEIHKMGLKIGIYSTPWVEAYSHYIGGSANNPEGAFTPDKENVPYNEDLYPYIVGKYTFVNADVKQWTAWGIDFLKYDWNPVELPETKTMYEALRNSGRDMVFSLSNSIPFEIIDSLSHYGNSWRTGEDIRDNWNSIKSRLFSQDKWAPYAGPGHWNDPDMLVIGYVGWGHDEHLTHLTCNEQYTQISAWCLMSAPLLLGCDLTKLDPFTLSLLTNDEVLALDQDPLGKQATIVYRNEENELILAKDLADGSKAVGLFNTENAGSKEIVLKWSDLKISGKYIVRDLWRQKDLGVFNGEVKGEVPEHGVLLLKIEKK